MCASSSTVRSFGSPKCSAASAVMYDVTMKSRLRRHVRRLDIPVACAHEDEAVVAVAEFVVSNSLRLRSFR